MKTQNLLSSVRGFGFSLALLLAAVSQSPAQTSLGTPPPGPPIPAPLTVTIIAPTNGTFFSAPADVNISADARDFGSYVHVISFYANSNLLATRILDPIGPSQTNGQVINIQFDWSSVPAGAYSLTVVASDTGGNTATSAPVNITVLNLVPPLPVVTIFATDPIAAEGTNFAPYFPISAATNYMSPGTNTATFLVHRTGSNDTNLTVYYSIGGTASNGVDYVKVPGSVTIPAGKTFALVTIIPIKRVTPVAAAPFYRTVILGLIPSPLANPLPPGYVVGIPRKAEAIILERNRFVSPFPPVPILPTPPPFGPLADASFNVNYPAANGANYCIQVSTDMKSWTPVCTNTVIKSACVFIDPDTGSYPARYYRAVPVAAPAIY